MFQISDIHLWYSTRVLTALRSIVAETDPDIIVLTGDYYDIPAGARNFREFLLSISRRHLVIFIRGNHDSIYGSNVSGLLAGIPNCVCVEDSVFRYRSKAGHFYNITSWKNRKSLPAPDNDVNIALIHNPERIKEKELSNISLILAGHLHGGQFIFFTSRDNSHFPGNLLYRHCTDRKQIGNTTLIVSKGLGDTLPLRWNCQKEIVRITIT
ncbi:MAG TPA: metallophosphoesterase [Chryseosolibacter sp.]|nr:metallophosphoesterase [Chryseosolibacter sp.]